jgi:hypothetical protein
MTVSESIRDFLKDYKSLEINEENNSYSIKITIPNNRHFRVVFIPQEELKFVRIFIPIVRIITDLNYEEIMGYVNEFNLYKSVYGTMAIMEHEKEKLMTYSHSICLVSNNSLIDVEEFKEILNYFAYMYSSVNKEFDEKC